jgi:transcriptional regulator with XRE-family HTH domain
MPGEIRLYRTHRHLSQVELAEALGVTQAYVSQLERGTRRVSRKLAAKLAALPAPVHLEATVFPEDLGPLDGVDIDLAGDLAALGYPGFAAREPGTPRNPASVIVSILRQRHVAPGVMAAIPWVLLHFPAINTRWLVDRARLDNLQNRLGFLTDLTLDVARARRAAGRFDEAHLATLEAVRGELESSRLAKEDTLARELTPAERQFFEEHRTPAARHWNLLTGLTKDTLPHVRQ